MKRFSLLLVLVLGVCWAPSLITPIASVSAAQAKNEKKEIRVWVNTRSGVYHCPGTRWYGKTKQGEYLTETEAQKDGYRPAYARPCGSDSKTKSGVANSKPKNESTPPSGATALCRDGTYSFSQHRRGTCSHHGGVSKWLNPN